MQEVPEMMDTIDLRQYVAILRKWRWVVVLITIMSMATAGVVSFFVLPPVYETKVTMLVSQPAAQRPVRQETGVEEVASAISRLPEMTLNTYVGQVLSPYFLDQVATSMKFDKTIVGAKELATMMDARVIKDTNLIEVRVRNTDRVLAADIANTMAREFLEFISKNVQDQMGKSVRFLQDQIALVKKDLDAANNKMKNLKTESSSIEILQNEVNARFDMLAKAREQLANAKAEQALTAAGYEKAKQILDDFKKDKELMGIPMTDDKETRARVAGLEQIVNTKDVELAQKNAQVAAIEERVAQVSLEVEQIQRQLVYKKTEYEQLDKQIQQLEETYKVLSERILQAQMARSLNMGEANISVVSPALIPTTPVRPNKKLNVAVAGVLGIFLSLGLVFVLEYLDNTMKNPDDVRKHLGLPTLGNIPVIE
ncbi:MAG: hypothetical protein HPY55_08545 [Firmicutes bacterium]|nr:hypothetical protein [Bacillota bacterium]